jgi:hypothetical protein
MMTNIQRTNGPVALAGILLMGVAAVLAIVTGIILAADPGRFVEGMATLALAGLAASAATLAWSGPRQVAGVLGIAAALGFILTRPESAGVLALIGGLLALFSERIDELPQRSQPTE